MITCLHYSDWVTDRHWDDGKNEWKKTLAIPETNNYISRFNVSTDMHRVMHAVNRIIFSLVKYYLENSFARKCTPFSLTLYMCCLVCMFVVCLIVSQTVNTPNLFGNCS